MIAIVYSGSNYAEWRLTDRGRTIASFKTSAINPYFNDEKYILQLLNKNINLIGHAEEIKRIYFFGAGSSSTDLKAVVTRGLASFFKNAKVTVDHDIVAAAIATCKNSPGIVCICASGSNAAWYDGRKVKSNNYGLGYILADEGSGNWLGRQLLKGFMNETLPESINALFEHRYDIDRKNLLEKIYRQKQPALYLSTFAEFFNENHDDPYVKTTVKKGFKKLVDTYLIPLSHQHPGAPLHFVGTVASNFQDYLTDEVEKAGLQIASVIKEPINNLLTYYSNKN